MGCFIKYYYYSVNLNATIQTFVLVLCRVYTIIVQLKFLIKFISYHNIFVYHSLYFCNNMYTRNLFELR